MNISKTEIENIKNSLKLSDFLRNENIILKKHTQNELIGHCPFHNDKTPSFVVNHIKNLWHCLGACSVGGDIFTFVQKKYNLNFIQSINYLESKGLIIKNKRLDGEKMKYYNDFKEETKIKLDKNYLTGEETNQELLFKMIDKYHQELLADNKAKAYMIKRGIDNEQVIKHFLIGSSNQTLARSYNSKLKNKSTILLKKQLREIGLIRSNNELFNGKLIFPLFNRKGEIV